MSDKIKLPESVRVGYRVYTIEAWASSEASGARRYGQCCHLSLKIKVDLTYGPVQAAETLLHELLHACWVVSSLDDIESPIEEVAVGHLSGILTQVFQDNPEVMDWIGKHARGE